MRVLIAAAALLALGACSGGAEPPAEETHEAGVEMKADVQVRMGVKLGKLAEATARISAPVYARVVDAGPLAQLDADLASAQAAVAASSAEAKRLRALADADQSAAPKAVEAAEAQARADQARAALASQRVGLEWGPGLARFGVSGRGKILDEIARGRAALVRIDAPGVTLTDVAGVTLKLTRDGAPIAATTLGPAITSDPRLQAQGLFALVRGPQAKYLPAGKLLFGEIALGAPRSGVLIPRTAIVRMDGAMWVYAPNGADTFERKEVANGEPQTDGWFVVEGFNAGETIVTDGAGALLAVERGPSEAE
jgi:hypothetical protein